jgi:hypothetical protein
MKQFNFFKKGINESNLIADSNFACFEFFAFSDEKQERKGKGLFKKLI